MIPSTIPPPSNRTICVLGMHRSGTSCLAGTLEQAGVFLGEVATQNRFNAKGNRENLAVREVNGQVLHDNGGDWDRPPVGSAPPVWREGPRRLRDEIIRRYAGQPVWGFKDPRTLWTLDGWLEALPALEFVGVVRHPLAVARSLHARPRGPELAAGLRLWLAYNERLHACWQRFGGFPIVSFDAPAERLAANLRDVVRRLNLPAGSREPAFFDPELQHQATSDDADDDRALLTAEIRRLHARLAAIAMP